MPRITGTQGVVNFRGRDGQWHELRGVFNVDLSQDGATTEYTCVEPMTYFVMGSYDTLLERYADGEPVLRDDSTYAIRSI